MIANVAKPELKYMRDENKASQTYTLLEKRRIRCSRARANHTKQSKTIRDVLFFCKYVLPAKQTIRLPQSPTKSAVFADLEIVTQ